MKIKSPLISVVICTASRPKDALACVMSLQHQTYQNFEIIVVDAIRDSFLGSEFKKLSKKQPIRHIKITAHNLPLARNTGIKHSKGEIVAFIDDDAIPQKSWLKEINSFFQKNADVGVLGGKILSFYPNYPGLFLEAFFNVGDDPIEVNQVVGVNMAIYRKRVMAKGQIRKNLFDQKLVTAGDDTEFSYYLKNKGVLIFFDPRMVVYHKFRSDLKDFARRQLDYAAGDLKVMTKAEYQQYSVINSYFKFLNRNPSKISIHFYFLCLALESAFIFSKEKGLRWLPLSILRELSYSYGIYKAWNMDKLKNE